MNVKYIKSFNKGQITIPKEFRDILGTKNEFWLKVYLEGNKIIAEPIDSEKNKANYKNRVLKIKGVWLNPQELADNRKQIEKRLQRNTL